MESLIFWWTVKGLAWVQYHLAHFCQLRSLETLGYALGIRS